ncbi:MAG TPA: hypothetical protein VEG63_12270 [Candidatus Acidoferrales bacterium]|nr:hypothetical protein [Candidatus Acidoferrales bacterium]
MLGILILAFSIAALGQFVVFYARAVLASVAAQPLAGYVQQIEGFPSRPLQGEDFPHLVQLQRICPQVGPEARGLHLARVYYQTLSAVKRAVNGYLPGLHGWAEHEQTLCARFAAVLLDQRLARTAAAAADMRSY